jgi:hypothetical protein
MRSLVRSIYTAVGIIVFAGVQNAGAQILDAVTFTTSFPFTVGNTTMPAGSYTINPDVDNPQILDLSGAGGSVLFQVELTEANKTRSTTEVVFKRYGDRYLLKDIWVEGQNSGATATAAEGERHANRLDLNGEQRVAAQRSPKPRN